MVIVLYWIIASFFKQKIDPDSTLESMGLLEPVVPINYERLAVPAQENDARPTYLQEKRLAVPAQQEIDVRPTYLQEKSQNQTMAAYNPYSSWKYRNQTYDEESDSDYGDQSVEHYEARNGACYEDGYAEEEDLIVTEVLDNYLPETWCEMHDYNEVKVVPLHKYSSEFKYVVRKIQSTLKVNVHRVERVQNPYLWGSYILMKGEYKKTLKKSLNEMELFHATSQNNVQSIVENNFDWRRTVRSKFGKGVSFSPYADYANDYCNRKAGINRAMILTRVLVGRCQGGSYKRDIPDFGYDTTIGNGDCVYVKYGDNEYYPEYVAYYDYYD